MSLEKIKERIGGSQIKSIGDGFGGYRRPEESQNEKYIEELQISKEAMDYLLGRNLTSNTIKHFKLGYCKARKAISIPIYKNKQLINIRYRDLDPKAKTRYTQEKGCETWIYNEAGIDEGIKKKHILVVEGEFDLMSVWQNGIEHVVSPSSGATSYGPWVELLDDISWVHIAYDNDKAGKKAAYEFAQRVDIDKCFECVYPEGIKDANEFFSKYTREDFSKMIKAGKRYAAYDFQGVPDIIRELREDRTPRLTVGIIPFIEFEEDWLAIISGDSNTGKTSWVMNVASELADKNVPTLIMPFERGIKTVGKRFLQVRHDADEKDFVNYSNNQWDRVIEDAASLPLYFSMPRLEDIDSVVRRGKRLFNIKFVIIDHLNYLVRSGDKKQVEAEAEVMMTFKALAQELGVVFLIVHHISKPDTHGKPRKLRKEDLKGSSSLYQDPEAVIMLDKVEDTDLLEINIVKNKGPMGSRFMKFNPTTGKMKLTRAEGESEEERVQRIFDEI